MQTEDNWHCFTIYKASARQLKVRNILKEGGGCLIIYMRRVKSQQADGDAIIVIGRVPLYAISRDLGKWLEPIRKRTLKLTFASKSQGCRVLLVSWMQGSCFTWSASGKPSSAGKRSR